MGAHHGRANGVERAESAEMAEEEEQVAVGGVAGDELLEGGGPGCVGVGEGEPPEDAAGEGGGGCHPVCFLRRRHPRLASMPAARRLGGASRRPPGCNGSQITLWRRRSQALIMADD